MQKKIHILQIRYTNKKKLIIYLKRNKFHTVINLAAQAGVRHSLKKPEVYFETNLRGFFNIIEACKNFKVKHLISASTSSVYGNNHISKFDVNSAVGHPTQFYAATKRSNELIGTCLFVPIRYSNYFFKIFHSLWTLGKT